jgi:hypothetical protein
MTKQVTFLLLFLLVVSTVSATIRRVGYGAPIPAVTGLDYLSFQAAYEASNNFDTIQLYASTNGSVSYSGTISKPIVILGPGYFTNSFYLTGTQVPNANLTNMAGSMASCTFTIDLGSAGTIIKGLNNLSINVIDRVDSLNNINISRCRNVNVSFTNSGKCNKWTIAQCYGVSISQSGYSPSFILDRTIDSLSIQNCVLASAIALNTSPVGSYTGNSFYNCNFLSGASLALNNAIFTIQNCIFENQSFTGVTNTTFKNNVTATAAAGNTITNTGLNSGNVFGTVLSSIYAGYPTNTLVGSVDTYSPDARFQLKAAPNAAINAGLLPGTATATNCGIYGGSNPYVLSGMPPIPAIYQLGAASTVITGSSYTLTFSIKSNN